MAFDLLITNGTVIDGLGGKRITAAIGVKDGRIAAIGDAGGAAAATIDARGQIVCPGFVDPHTHYDAQISWDSVLAPSAEHGVTSVVMGNCGVGLAPCRPGDHQLLIQDLINVEGMSEQVLTAGVKWDWESFPDYMDAAQRRGSGINLAFLVPLAPLRTYVLGREATQRAATANETAEIARLLREAIEAGAWGFSTTANPAHIGYQGKTLAARPASRDELIAYAGVLKQSGRGVIELSVIKRYSTMADDEFELVDFLLTHSGRPVTWLSLHNHIDKPGGTQEVLRKAEPLYRRGAIPQVMCRPLMQEFTLRTPGILNEITAAKSVFNLPREKQMEIYADPAFRDGIREELKLGRKFTNQAQHLIVHKAADPALVKYENMTIGEVAKEWGCDPLDAFFDFGLKDNIETQFVAPRANNDKARIPELISDPRTMIGLSDAGAHVDMVYEAGYTTYILGTWVREKKAMELEYAIKRMTSEPADFFGLKDRGRLVVGAAADIVIFDEQKINSAERPQPISDLPAGGTRLHSGAEGISHVIVNGRTVFRDNQHTGELPGVVLRSR